MHRLDTLATLGLGFDGVRTLVFVLMGQPPSIMPAPPKPMPATISSTPSSSVSSSNFGHKKKARGRSQRMVESHTDSKSSESSSVPASTNQLTPEASITATLPFRISHPRRRPLSSVLPASYSIPSHLLQSAAHIQLADLLCSPHLAFQLINPSKSCAGTRNFCFKFTS